MIQSIRDNFRKYTVLTKAGIIDFLTWRVGIFSVLIGNLVYLVVIYFLWKAIFAASPTPTVSGMTFEDTMIYLVLASALFYYMEIYLVWNIGNDVKTGKIILDLVRPMDYQLYSFCNVTGNLIVSLITTFIPTMIIVDIITKGAIPLGLNLLWFFLSIILSAGLNFFVEFFVGTICIHTQSVWGINILKVMLVSLLSGATIPIAFFPETLQKVVGYLPFQAMYNVPLNILIKKDLPAETILQYFGTQLFWLVALFAITRIFWLKTQKAITVNGG